MDTNNKYLKKETVSNYSSRNANHYDDPMNKNFVYGEMTVNFVNQLNFEDKDNVVADIGCGTGFAYDILYEKIKDDKRKFIGVEPAKGMLDLAVEKFKSNENFSFQEGTFAKIPLEDNSVDKIISTLALHWVPSLDDSIKELKRVLKPNGSIDIMMTAKDDGEGFKKPIIVAMQKHLNFKQIMKASALSQRVSPTHIQKYFSKEFDLENDYTLNVDNVKKVIYGTFDQHMKWWKARSEQIISEVKNKEQFMNDLKETLETIKTDQGIPFDLSILHIKLKGKK
jgi:ubiquinone/menaquinone biosynthesis C-methylase UbiE